jgi:hypothetical protein
MTRMTPDSFSRGLLQPADAVQRRGGREPDEAGQLDVGAVCVALERRQQPNVNIIKVNRHLTINYFVVVDTQQI